VSSAADVNANWEEIKQAERAAKAAAAGSASGDVAAPSVLDGVPFGQPALSLAAQLQRRALRAGIAVHAVAANGGGVPGLSANGGAARAGDAAVSADGAGTGMATATGELTGERAGDALMALVALVREAGLDPELELRAAARRFADSVRERERSVGSVAE
jgi:XTP/dITP diphosphohydrolase